MEVRPRRHGGRPSPERTKVWVEPPPKHRQLPEMTRKVSVVYYLCWNSNLEHPHFIQVPLSSPDGLYLRDVIDRLNVLRGKGMPAMYSWSCKRRYKNGFVWQDLEEDDLLIPAHGNEYVLKGSELLDQSTSDRLHYSNISPQLQNPEQTQQEPPTSSRTKEASFSSSTPTIITKETRPPSPTQEHELSLNSYKANGRADASTQTEDIGGRRPDTHTKAVSSNDELLDLKFSESSRSPNPCFIEGSNNAVAEVSPLATSSIASSLGGKTVTLESLIRADASETNRCRVFNEEVLVPSKAKLKATAMLMQLITCGSISVKDQRGFGFASTYNQRFSHMKFPSPTFSSSLIMRELDLSENPRMIVRQEETKYFCRSGIKAKNHEEEVREVVPTLERSFP